jgi:hypothetical protein
VEHDAFIELLLSHQITIWGSEQGTQVRKALLPCKLGLFRTDFVLTATWRLHCVHLNFFILVRCLASDKLKPCDEVT